MGPLPISRTLLAFDLGIGTEARCSSSRQAFQSYQSSWPAVPSSMLVARLCQKACSYSCAANQRVRLICELPMRASIIGLLAITALGTCECGGQGLGSLPMADVATPS